MRWQRRPPIQMWANALRWGMDPRKVLEAIRGWDSVYGRN